MAEYKKLEAEPTNSGDYVLATQEVAKEDSYRNVSADWFQKTKPLPEVVGSLIQNRSQRSTLTTRLGRMGVQESAGRFALRVRDRLVFPDTYAAGQFGQMIGIGSDYPKKMVSSKNFGAAEALVTACEQGMRSSNELDKEVVLRVDRGEKGNILRGMISSRTNTISNEWYLGVLNRVVPGGRLSHLRGDAYTLYANLLIPDTIRQEEDSHYGAMVSISNCEILKRLCSQQPSLFRAICMNGCIWGQEKGKAYTISRRTSSDLDAVEKEIKKNIEQQIPLAIRALDRLLQTRSYRAPSSIKPVIAQVALDYRLKKSLASAVLQAWHVEHQLTPDLSHTLFGVVNAVTRAGQTQDNKTWVRFDEIGGMLAQMGHDEWDQIIARSARLSAKRVETRYETWSLAG